MDALPRPNTKPHFKQLTHWFPGTTKIWAPNSLKRGISILNSALPHIANGLTSSVIIIPLYEQVTAPEIHISLPFSPYPRIHNEKHPETHFVRHLIYMLQPRSFTINSLAKVIAASVSATMDEFFMPKPPVPPQAQFDEVNIYLDMISYFEGLKRPSIPPIELISMARQSPSGSKNAEESFNISSN
ncbi:hypothetical protein O181_106487 [Austropuccinia psidii MF-1]|uniref:Uncharacterized protein n=1 Tax=Austropuccinia psidii MF-1 TaxID=1389203 RepID=A0A9Q3JQI3_9BASI|nr:hypothetical protein [Austropuccinia psidii MF-1]